MYKPFTLLAAGAACLLAACSPDKGPKNDGPVTPDDPTDFKKEYLADQLGSSIGFTAEGSWTASVSTTTQAETRAEADDPWIDIEPKSGGAGANTLQVSLQPNWTGKEREAEITIVCLGSKTTFAVKQTAVTTDGDIPGVYYQADDSGEWTTELPEHPQEKLAVKTVGGAMLTRDMLRQIADIDGGPAVLDLGQAMYETDGFPLDYLDGPADYPGGWSEWDDVRVEGLDPEEIVLPGNVVKISSEAFAGSRLQTIDLSQIDSIGFAAFRNCRNLAQTTMSSRLRFIAESAFEGTQALQEITIPASITAVEAYTFMNSGLRTLNVQQGGDTLCIGTMAFRGCQYLRELNFGNREIHIQSEAFSQCIDLREAELTHVTQIGASAFEECTLLTRVTLGAADTIGRQAFASCPNLTTVAFNEGTTVIGYGAFKACERLAEITLPASIRRIEAYAFMACDLNSITFPENVDSLGGYMFQNNSNLKYIEFKTRKLKTIPDHFLYMNKAAGMIELPESVTAIGDYAFAFCEKLASISIGSQMKSIGECALRECPKLGNIFCHAAQPPVCGDYALAYSGAQSGMDINQCWVPAGSTEAYGNDPAWGSLAKSQNFIFREISEE